MLRFRVVAQNLWAKQAVCEAKMHGIRSPQLVGFVESRNLRSVGFRVQGLGFRV